MLPHCSYVFVLSTGLRKRARGGQTATRKAGDGAEGGRAAGAIRRQESVTGFGGTLQRQG